ncbi:helix-turn-helix domain-containing protein [Enterococcus thailandicus]|uniref:helix-turn-helix domain-containing protein n=1 Tax=Enterococcus thailandicus TaxID=417368 RepID=UPI0035E2794C
MHTLKEIRKEKNITLLVAANELGYRYPSSYAKIETGKQPLKSNQIPILANLFEVSEEKILKSSYSL